MNRPLRFAVIADTHYCWKKHHPAGWHRTGPLSGVPDYIRYTGMLETGGIPLLRKIADMHPEFLISTGDFVEGGLNGTPEYAGEEMLEGWNLLNRTGVPVLIAKGTYEGRINTPGGSFFREQILPKMEAGCGSEIFREYYRYDSHSDPRLSGIRTGRETGSLADR